MSSGSDSESETDGVDNVNDDDEAMYDDTSASSESTIGNKSKKGIIHSLLFGLIPGNVPPELIGLTTVEISMIALVNPLSKMRLEGKSHYEATKPTYTIINNVNTIAGKLPRHLSDTDFAILRSFQGTISKDFTFRPAVVMRALYWLKENNHLYAKVDLEIPQTWSADAGVFDISEISIATIDLSEEDTAVIDEGNDIVDQSDHSGHEASGTASDLLLISSFEGSSNMDLLQEALEDNIDSGQDGNSNMSSQTVSGNINVEKLFAIIVERGGQANFTDAGKEGFLIEMSFPQYFPYGRGGPGDPLSKHKSLSNTLRILKFANLALTSGGHYRKLQNDFRFISLCYFIFMRKRMAGMFFKFKIL